MRMILVVMAVSLLGAACGGGGACVVPSPTGRAGWEACHDNWDEPECKDRSGTFHGGSTCSAQGFTKSCPADGSNSYRLPSYGC